MSTKKTYVLLLKKDGKNLWESYEHPDSRYSDRDIFRDQGYEIVGEAEGEMKDDFPAFKLDGYGEKDKTANRFAEIFDDIVPGNFSVVGSIGGYEFTRENLQALELWIKKALAHCSPGPEKKK